MVREIASRITYLTNLSELWHFREIRDWALGPFSLGLIYSFEYRPAAGLVQIEILYDLDTDKPMQPVSFRRCSKTASR